MDDIENDEQVRNPEQRDKLNAWLTKTVLPLGGVGQKYDVIYIGTILHYDSVLNCTLNNPFWHGIKFKAMKRWPDRMDLWDRWEELFPKRRRDGRPRRFIRQTRTKWSAAVTLWAAQGVLALMKIRARDGHATLSEYQNDRSAAKMRRLPKHQILGRNCPTIWYYGALDPSLGKAGAGVTRRRFGRWL